MQYIDRCYRKHQDTRNLATVFRTGCNMGEIFYISSEIVLFHQNDILTSVFG